MDKIDYISGPKSLYYYNSGKYNKKIYIFGETHGFKNTCNVFSNSVYIYDYLEKLFKTTDEFIDFYLEYHQESDQIKKEYNDIQGYKPYDYFRRYPKENTIINILRLIMAKCIEPEFREKHCDYPNVRAHYTDIRVPFSKTIPYFMNDIINRKIKNYELIRLPEFRKFIEIIMTNNVLNYLIDEIYNNPGLYYLGKELRKSTLSKWDVYNILSSYKNLMDMIFIMNKNKELIKKIYTRDNIDVIKIVLNFIFRISSLFLDLYQLARIFKVFDTSDLPSEPKNIIVYAGVAHGEFLRSALRTLGFDLVAFSKNNSKDARCLDIRKFHQPFFTD